MKKIIFVIGNYKNGGMAMHATNLSNEFANHGYEVDILVTRELSEKSFFNLNKGVNVVSLIDYNNSTPSNNLVKAKSEKVYSKINFLKKIRYITKKIYKIDMIIEREITFLRRGDSLRKYFVNNQDSIVIPFGFLYLENTISAVKDLNCKVYYAEKNAPECEFPEKGSNEYRYIIKLMNKINGTIVQTQNAKDFFDGEIKNIYVINNPIKEGLPKPYLNKRKKTIVNFCRIHPQKNLDLLIDAFVKLNKEYPDYKLEIYGNIVSDFEIQYRDRLISKVQALNMENKIFILPPSSEVHKRIIDCAMFISSSDYEGLSNSMIEAMAIGLPCICTDCLGGGTREVMVDKENGLIVPIKDVNALYSAMKFFIENSELAENCGKKASELREKLSVKSITEKWLSVIEK
ncbi:MAG: glycosyltransferase [Ruminococcus sp.]|nr:glycosyltransferase [Ruminococcus sp.]